MFADLPLNLYEATVTMLPLLAVMVIYGHRQKQEGFPIAASSFFLLLVLGVYLLAVFHLTGSGTLWHALRNGLPFRKVHVVPFSQGIAWKAYFLNILLFVPLGFLIPITYSHQRSLMKILLYSFLLSLLIELSQLLSLRATDVDDLIMNTLGGALGYGIYHLLSHFYHGRFFTRRLPPSGLLLVPATVFLSRFLLFNDLGFLSLIHF